MDDWDAEIMAIIVDELLPQMQDATNRMAELVNQKAAGANGSLGGAASPGSVSVNGETLTSSVDIKSIPRPSVYPDRYKGADIYALFDSGYTVKKPVRDPRILKHRDPSDITEGAVNAFKGSDSLGINVWYYKPTGFI